MNNDCSNVQNLGSLEINILKKYNNNNNNNNNNNDNDNNNNNKTFKVMC